MNIVKLKFNNEKTEFIITDDRQARESIMQIFPTPLLGNSISPTDAFSVLSTLETPLPVTSHACYYHLSDLRHIYKFLSVKTTALLAYSMISS